MCRPATAVPAAWHCLALAGGGGTVGLIAVSGSASFLALCPYLPAPVSRLGLHEHSFNKHLQLSLRPAGSLYFGWLGSCLQMLGGLALMVSLKRPKCHTCPACPELPACTCPGHNKASIDVYEVSC
ncbi:unnamed protein product [Knipowitschia caucasica]|uniref:Uncharacterized protein n=1 Tax=Knipowitschia caucasica TaxID=637954 RepID=A0AAV2JFE2_KNICA